MTQFVSRRLTTDKREVTQQEAAAYGQLLIAFGIIEEAHALYRKGWIAKDNWEQWANWLKALSRNPEFLVSVTYMTRGTFDKEFEEVIMGVISGKSRNQPETWKVELQHNLGIRRVIGESIRPPPALPPRPQKKPLERILPLGEYKDYRGIPFSIRITESGVIP